MSSVRDWLPAVPRYYYEKVETVHTWTIDLDSVLEMAYVPEDADVAETVSGSGPWVVDATPPDGLELVTDGAVFEWGSDVHHSASGAVFRGWSTATGAGSAAGSMSSEGAIQLTTLPSGATNAITWRNIAQDRTGSLDILGGSFRTDVVPLKPGAFQIQDGPKIGNANSGGVISGDFTGLVDFERGFVGWAVAGLGDADNAGEPVRADQLTYNAVYLRYVPLDADLLGLSTVRLPLDGKAPIYRAGDQVIIHHTDTLVLPNPLTKGQAYSCGRERLAWVELRDANGARVSGALFEVGFDAGTVTVLAGADLSPYTQPLTVHHRIEDELQLIEVDISGKLSLAGRITHAFPAEETFVSSKMQQGDRFARVYGYRDRVSWQGSWQSTADATAEPTASLNWIDFPIQTTNRGAIRERWAIQFLTATTVRVFGEAVGQVLYGASVNEVIEAPNPANGAMYFRIPVGALSGGGWSAGNVALFETDPAGGPGWIVRTTLIGPASEHDDSATIAYRLDAN